MTESATSLLGLRRASKTGAPEVPAFSILATACVRPPNFPSLERSDPQARLDDYVEALTAIVLAPDARIGPLVVLENSGADPDDLLRRLLDRVPGGIPRRGIEILSYQSPARQAGLHYGYSEFQMIDDLLDRSETLGSRFVKITGRYRFPALARLLERLPARLDFLCDSQDIPALPGRRAQRSINSSIFVADRRFFDVRIRRLYRDMREEHRFTHVENIIFDALYAEHDVDGPVTLRLPISCDPVGIGGNGIALSATGVKAATRRAARQAFPDLWL